MATQKWCSIAGCKNFIFATLNDFADNGWSAFQIPSGNGKVRCFCPDHQTEMKEQMHNQLNTPKHSKR